MPKTQKSNKTTKTKDCVTNQKIYEEISKLSADLKKLAKSAQEKYEKADPRTKRKIINGIAGASAIIAGVIGVKKIFGKKEKK